MGETDKGREVCPLCGDADSRSLGRVDDRYELRACAGCGFIHARPRPTLEEIVAFYNEHDDYNRAAPPLPAEKAKRRVAPYRMLIHERRPQAKRILEIGCLHGEALYGLRQWGYETVGADLNRACIEYARKHYGIVVHAGEGPPEEFAGSFDVLILSHVIEHLLDPVDFLQRAGRFLKTGGMVVIEAPGVDTALFDLFGPDYNMVRPPEHIDFFTMDTIRTLLERAGFTPETAFTRTPIWEQRNLFLYGLLSLARRTGALQRLRRRRNPDSAYATSAPMRVGKRSPLSLALTVADYGTRVASVLCLPLLRLLDRRGKGLLLFAIGRKQ